MGMLIGDFGFIFAIVFAVPFIIIPIVIFFGTRRVFQFQSRVFKSMDKDLFRKIDQAEKPNRSYVKTKCDNCG